MTVYQSTSARKQILKISSYSGKDEQETDLHQLGLDENYFCGVQIQKNRQFEEKPWIVTKNTRRNLINNPKTKVIN